MMKKNPREVILHFAKGNAWFAGILVAMLAIPDFRNIMSKNIVQSLCIVGILELVFAVAAFILSSERGEKTVFRNFDSSWSVESLVIRFGESQDKFGTESVYQEWFSDDVAIDDDEYDAILARGGFVRVLEADMKKGGREERSIVGYYSVFPLSVATFDKLKTGQIKEMHLKCSDVLSPSNPDAKILYIPEICESKNRNVGPALVRDLLRYVAHIVNNNPNIVVIAAWPYTKYGKQLIKDFKMKPSDGRRFFQNIYQMSRASVSANRIPSGGFKERRRVTF